MYNALCNCQKWLFLNEFQCLGSFSKPRNLRTVAVELGIPIFPKRVYRCAWPGYAYIGITTGNDTTRPAKNNTMTGRHTTPWRIGMTIWPYTTTIILTWTIINNIYLGRKVIADAVSPNGDVVRWSNANKIIVLKTAEAVLRN